MGRFIFPQVQQKMNDVEVRETEIFDWKKKVTEAACKLKQHENVLETVVSERNLYSKNLIETQVIAKWWITAGVITQQGLITPGKRLNTLYLQMFIL